jgi:eukaryotic-like serine/threonine-protein kinase
VEQNDFGRLQSALTGRFSIRAELGRGGTSVVFLADDVGNGRTVALKVVRADVSATLVLKRFQREIELASQLHHPNILPVVEVGDAAGRPYYVMPAVDGGSLYDLLSREGALPFAQVIEIARAVANALDYAHQHNIIHRDIKPANILFQQGRPVVADFGIARAFGEAGAERLTDSGVAVGTPPYMSPEQAGNERELDGRSDIYSLACVVFEMMTGEVPFGGQTASAIIAKHVHAPPPAVSMLRPTVPPQVQSVMECALAKQRADRYATPREFVDALEAALAGAPAHGRKVVMRRGVWRVAAFIAAASAALWLTTRDAPATNPALTTDLRNVAVLYFDDLSASKSLEHIASGLTEDLIDQLSQVSALRVISPSGVRPFRGSTASPDTIARRLAVGMLVSGSIATSGHLYRISVRLIDAQTGAQLRTLKLERPAWDLFQMQDSVSTEVAFWLRERLGEQIRLVEGKRGTKSVEAWEAFQRAEEIRRRNEVALLTGAGTKTEITLIGADSALADAERLDPQWPAPVIARARNAYTIAFSVPQRMKEEVAEALRITERALRMAPRSPEALAIRGELLLRQAWFGLATNVDSLLARAEVDLRDAASARPDLARTWYALGDALYAEGRFADATESYQTALRADAFLGEARSVKSGLFFSMLQTERFDEARSLCTEAKRRYPDDPRFTECGLTLIGWTGRTEKDVGEGWRDLTRIETADSTGILAAQWCFRRMLLAAVAARAGLRDSATAIVTRTNQQRGARPRAASAEAYVHTLLGHQETAIALLREAVSTSPLARRYVAGNSWFRPLRGNPEFRALVQPPVTFH